jgi:hypothetical protein
VFTRLLEVLEDGIVEFVVVGLGRITYPATATTAIITTITAARICLDIALLDCMPKR